MKKGYLKEKTKMQKREEGEGGCMCVCVCVCCRINYLDVLRFTFLQSSCILSGVSFMGLLLAGGEEGAARRGQ
jgi:hypothetical protein